MPSRPASSRMGMGRRAIRRNALIFPKLTPVCSLTSRRRWLSSTRAAMACHASRAARSRSSARLRHAGFPSRNSGLIASAVRWAVPRAHGDVATRPSDQHYRSAPGQDPPAGPAGQREVEVVRACCNEADTSEPTTATPRVWPTWREVEAMAAATPAWARGMPETAVLVIGAFTKPKPMPKIT